MDNSSNSRLTISAYNNLSPHYRGMAQNREPYLSAVNRDFISLARDEGPTWLDVGSGDGARALRINKVLNKKLSIVEPSKLLPLDFEQLHPEVEVFRGSAEQLSVEGRFDVVTMLWNVIGHVESIETCLHLIRKSMKPSGLLYLDANSALNVRRFGIHRVSLNVWRKRSAIFPWPNAQSSSYVEIFRKSFLARLLRKYGFQASFRFMDYENGEWVRSQYSGSLIVAARKLT